MGGVPKIVILGHSFVSRLKQDLEHDFHPRASLDFGLVGSANIFFQGIGGRTVRKLRTFDLERVRRLKPSIIILEIGTNDLSLWRAEWLKI